MSTDVSGIPLYDILTTPYGGRSAFAREKISKGSPVLHCSAPYASVIFWKFKREVCAWCFAYAFESGKSKWSIKLGEDHRGAGGAWFCSEGCREECIRENEIFEGQGIGWWLEINGAFERLVAQMGKSGKQDRKPTGRIPPANALAYLEDTSMTDLTPEYVDRAWGLAEEVAAEESNQERKMKWTEVLNELEMDTARFVLDGLVRKAVEDINPSFSILDRITEAPGYCMGAGRWTNLLELQDNEVALEHSKPYMLASSIRVYRFLRHLATSLSKQGVRSDPRTQEAPPLIYLPDQLRTSLANSSAARSLMGRDHGNTFGIWDMVSDDEGSEMLGWGAYVFGSYFNHG